MTEELLSLTNLCGPEGWVKERLAAYKEAGVTHLNVIPIATGGQTQADVLEKVKAWSE